MPWRETSAMDERLQRRYTWRARKVRRLLQARVPAEQVPTKTTIHRILERHGRVRPRRRRRGDNHKGRTPKCYPSPEYKLLPIAWTVHHTRTASPSPCHDSVSHLRER
jgi:hypothetical protein